MVQRNLYPVDIKDKEKNRFPLYSKEDPHFLVDIMVVGDVPITVSSIFLPKLNFVVLFTIANTGTFFDEQNFLVV